jgi:hypothetical protein
MEAPGKEYEFRQCRCQIVTSTMQKTTGTSAVLLTLTLTTQPVALNIEDENRYDTVSPEK